MSAASCSELLEAIDLFVEMGASAPDPRQAYPLRRLDSDGRFVAFVAGQVIDDPLRWCDPRSVDDQLR